MSSSATIGMACRHMSLSLASRLVLGAAARPRLGAGGALGRSLARRLSGRSLSGASPLPTPSCRPPGLGSQHRGRPWCVTTRAAISKSGGGAKSKQRYLCLDCGEDYSQWRGQCPGCKAWESFTLFTVEPASSAGGGTGGGGGAGARAVARATADAPLIQPRAAAAATAPAPARRSKARGGWVAEDPAPRRLSDILSPEAVSQRVPRVSLPGELGAEIERVIGGGVVPGALVLVGGDPGAGACTRSPHSST